jgi:hypothetical protein
MSEAGTACGQSWFVKRRRKKNDCGGLREDVQFSTVWRMAPMVIDLRVDTFCASMTLGCDAVIVVGIVDVKLWKYFWLIVVGDHWVDLTEEVYFSPLVFQR